MVTKDRSHEHVPKQRMPFSLHSELHLPPLLIPPLLTSDFLSALFIWIFVLLHLANDYLISLLRVSDTDSVLDFWIPIFHPGKGADFDE